MAQGFARCIRDRPSRIPHRFPQAGPRPRVSPKAERRTRGLTNVPLRVPQTAEERADRLAPTEAANGLRCEDADAARLVPQQADDRGHARDILQLDCGGHRCLTTMLRSERPWRRVDIARGSFVRTRASNAARHSTAVSAVRKTRTSSSMGGGFRDARATTARSRAVS